MFTQTNEELAQARAAVAGCRGEPSDYDIVRQENEAAARVLDRVLGEDVVAALRAGLLDGDLAAAVDALITTRETDHPRQRPLTAAARDVLVTAGGRPAALFVGRVLGGDVVAALRAGFSAQLGHPVFHQGGDLTGVVPLLVAESAAPHLRTATQAVFMDACDAGEADLVRLLVGCDGVDGNAPVEADYAGGLEDDEGGDNVLTRAARYDHGYVVHALVASGRVDVNRAGQNGELPLLQALGSVGCCSDASAPARHGFACCVEALLAAEGIDLTLPDGEGWTALMTAATRGNTAWLRHILGACGSAVNHSSDDGDTALIQAAGKGHTDCLHALLQVGGIRVNQADGVGKTALHAAAQHGHAACVRALLGMDGIAVNRVDRSGYTPLLVAAVTKESDWQDCVRALAKAKHTAVNAPRPRTNQTTLHMVCNANDAALAALLLVAGGCRFALDAGTSPSGASARQHAVARHHAAVVRREPGTPRLQHAMLHSAASMTRPFVCSAWLVTNQKLTTLFGARYARCATCSGGATPLDYAEGDKAVRKVFASGVDYWQRRLHGGHAWAMKEVVWAVLLVRQRLDADALAVAVGALPHLPHLPEEIWLAALAFLRSADFMPLHL